MNRKIVFLSCGLCILLVAFVCRSAGLPAYCFWVSFGMAITLKILFLVFTFIEKGFKPKPWLYCIQAGVALILLSMLFKTIIPMPAVYDVLFYGAITLKITGFLLMLFSLRK